jgi:hypothetical protein
VTAWLLSFGWNWLLVPIGIWFARGLWLATQRPWLTIKSITMAGREYIVEVDRQQQLPPWISVRECWLVDVDSVVARRESDGMYCSYSTHIGWKEQLPLRLKGLILFQQARDRETEELSK